MGKYLLLWQSRWMQLRERRLTRDDGRVVAWTESGSPSGRPVLRLPGTPGSRIPLRPDASPWTRRGLRMITTERPGFGASSRLPDHGFLEHADDLVAILDSLSIEALPAIGGSGGAPYLLAFMTAHPRRVSAASIVMGMAPVSEQELDTLIPINAAFLRLAWAGDISGLHQLLSEAREAIITDPIGRLQHAMATAPPADRAVIADPAFQQAYERSTLEALRQGVDGWVDECLAIGGRWSDIDVPAITGSITWWHGKADRNASIAAARRLVDRLKSAELRVWTEAGHLTAFHQEGAVLDELLSRA
jgi:pimeloyl-ACP methyl ester carboxylesterase